MISQFLTIGTLMLLSAMLPGPDFALVTKNSILHSRRAGIFTSLGITAAVLVHMTYCLFGLAIVISQSLILFSLIKYIGAAYLFYLGTTMLMSKSAGATGLTTFKGKSNAISDFTAFRQGFLCNLLNPKATLFFLALFTAIIKPNTPKLLELTFIAEMLLIIFAWFCTLTLIISHPRIIQFLNKAEKYIEKAVGVFLIGFGIALCFVK